MRASLAAALALSGAVILGSQPVRADAGRISFLVTAVEETAEGRTSIARTLVDGAPGTDFTISLETGPFTMEALFRTDLAGEDLLTVRSLLKTRRRLGLSERGLPLYEEDVQRSRMDLGFDEALALLPFGGRGADPSLRIEIVPTRRPEAPPGPMEIRILEPAPGGSLQVRAERIPHDFLAGARLLDGAEPVAEGRARLYLEERGAVRLAALHGARGLRGGVLEIDLETGLPGRACPGGPVALTFDLHALGPAGRRTEIGRGWAGAGLPGSPIVYDLEPGLLGLEAPRLEITIRPADGGGEETMKRSTP